MRKTLTVLGLGALLVTLSLGASGSAQMSGPMHRGETSPVTLEQDIELLKVLNRAGLSPDQLGQLQALLGELRAVEQEPLKARQALKAFLLGWQGSPEEFEAALAPLEAQLEQAQQAVQAKRQALVARLKGLLSDRQGEVLFEGLKRLGTDGMGPMAMRAGTGHGGRAPSAAMGGRRGNGSHPSQAEQGTTAGASGGMMGMMNMMMNMHQMRQGMQGGMGPMAGQADWDALLSDHLDALERVIQEKLTTM